MRRRAYVPKYMLSGVDDASDGDDLLAELVLMATDDGVRSSCIRCAFRASMVVVVRWWDCFPFALATAATVVGGIGTALVFLSFVEPRRPLAVFVFDSISWEESVPFTDEKRVSLYEHSSAVTIVFTIFKTTVTKQTRKTAS